MAGRLIAAFAVTLCASAEAATAQPRPSGAGASGPSFSCAHVTSHVSCLICSDPELSALDRALNDAFQAVVNQPTVSGAALRVDEAHWAGRVLQQCDDARCIKTAYSGRIAVLRRISLTAASPAAYAETRPFAAPQATIAESQAIIGRSCDGVDNLSALGQSGPHPLGGFTSRPGQAPIIRRNAAVFVLTRGAASLAFLFSRSPPESGRCKVADVVVLPKRASTLMSCAVDPQKSGAVGSTGIGVRYHGGRLAYWEISDDGARLTRQPLAVIGWTRSVRCQEPETGE